MKTKKKAFINIAAALFLLALCTACGNSATATSMRLMRTEGRVKVEDEEGEKITTEENMGLYSGYQMETRKESYAWINLDSVKLAKMDSESKIEIRKDGKKLELLLNEGSVFFNITEPLEEDESLEIRTSTMAVGIRGTCGWVSVDGNIVTVGLLEGKVECTPKSGKAVNLEAGWKAVLNEGGEITVSPLKESDIPAFIREEEKLLLEEALRIGREASENRDAEGMDATDDSEGGENSDGQETSDPYQLPPELDDGIERTIVEVATREDMIALRNADLSNVEIHLTADLYQLGDSTFSVYNAVNLRIIGGPSTRVSGGKNGADTIFFARNCENLMLYQIEFGNDTDGEMNECISLYQCSGAKIENCVVYSGMYGIHGDVCSGTVSGCEIHGCLGGGLYWRNGDLTLENCILRDNGSASAYYDNSPMFQLTDASLQLIDCEMYQNTCSTYIGSSLEKDGRGGRIWVPDTSPVTETGTTSEGNLWQEDNS